MFLVDKIRQTYCNNCVYVCVCVLLVTNYSRKTIVITTVFLGGRFNILHSIIINGFIIIIYSIINGFYKILVFIIYFSIKYNLIKISFHKTLH